MDNTSTSEMDRKMENTVQSITRLIEKSRCGDREAFARIVEKYQDMTSDLIILKPTVAGVLISSSLFHLEFIPPRITKMAIEAANRVLDGAFIP